MTAEVEATEPARMMSRIRLSVRKLGDIFVNAVVFVVFVNVIVVAFFIVVVIFIVIVIEAIPKRNPAKVTHPRKLRSD